MPAIAAFVPARSGRSEGDSEAIRDLGLTAIRGVVDGDRPGAAQRIAELTELAAAAGVSVEIELTVDPVDRSGIANLATAVASSPVLISRIFVFDARSTTGYDSSDAALAAVGGALAGVGIRIDLGGGTRANFTELNRLRPVPRKMAVVTYGINPQVHAFDESSIVETLEILPQTVGQARAIVGRRPLSIPVSFRARVNAAIGRARFEPDEGGPARADPRQRSAFVAAWSLGAVAALARRGVQSLSLFETLGPAGLGEIEAGPKTYPVGAVVAALASLRSAPIRTISTRSAAAIAAAGRGRILVANLGPVTQRITLPAPWAGVARLRSLRPAPWVGAPENGWVESRQSTFREGRPALLELGPWQTVQIDPLDVKQAGHEALPDERRSTDAPATPRPARADHPVLK